MSICPPPRHGPNGMNAVIIGGGGLCQVEPLVSECSPSLPLKISPVYCVCSCYLLCGGLPTPSTSTFSSGPQHKKL